MIRAAICVGIALVLGVQIPGPKESGAAHPAICETMSPEGCCPPDNCCCHVAVPTPRPDTKRAPIVRAPSVSRDVVPAQPVAFLAPASARVTFVIVSAKHAKSPPLYALSHAFLI